ncbi:potassium channel LctB [Thalassobacillus cyri]|uniref:Potassium channel LctB n=1 Tax=Thalassobacillus cyri TaxID=571932 RepID=A0A1H4H4R5_9BACI|nr:potassium channel family protein [Thalassobacillus cyri]SEB16799.1 potassium channel LctB [Thalassobacillus cyri]
MIATISLLFITLLLIVSLTSFFRELISDNHHFSLTVFTGLLFLYAIVMSGFGLIYFILSMNGIPLLAGGGLQQEALLNRIGQAIYFSGVTLLTVGYGDIIPIGWGRPIALFEALIGYTIPAAMFVRVIYGSKHPAE